MKEMTYEGDGKYMAEYVINRDGEVTMSVVLARRGGLWAEYFNNGFLNGVPAWQKVENIMSFDWGSGLVSREAADFVSAHWYGKLLAPTTEDYTFILIGDDNFRMFIDGKLLIDRWDSCCADMQVAVRLIEGRFYDIVL